MIFDEKIRLYNISQEFVKEKLPEGHITIDVDKYELTVFGKETVENIEQRIRNNHFTDVLKDSVVCFDPKIINQYGSLAVCNAYGNSINKGKFVKTSSILLYNKNRWVLTASQSLYLLQ